MTMESSSDVRDRPFSPTLDREVTPDHHQAARRENNSNMCNYAKTKTGLSSHNLCLDHVIRQMDHVIWQNVSSWSCIDPPNCQKQPKKSTKVKPTPKYDSPTILLQYREGFLMLHSMFNFLKTLQHNEVALLKKILVQINLKCFVCA